MIPEELDSRAAAWRLECINYLRAAFGAEESELVELYINEAEHQDGAEYWMSFWIQDDLRIDFELFVKNMKEARYG